MRLFWVLAAFLSHWRRNRVQLVAMLVGLSLATGLWSAVQAINGEARASYARAAALLGGDQVAALAPVAGGWTDQSAFVALRRAGVMASPLVEGAFVVDRRRYRLIGVEPFTLPREAAPSVFATPDGSEAEEEAGEDPLAFVTPPGLLIAAPATVERLSDTRVRAALGLELPPLRADPSLPPDTLVADIGVAQTLLGREGEITRILLAPGEAAPPELIAALGLREAASSDDAALAGLTDSFHLNLTAFGFLAYVVGLVIVNAAIGLATEQRLAMVRTLRACGASARDVALALGAEVVALALVAGLAGVALGYVVAGALLPDVAASLNGLYGVSAPGTLGFSPVWALGGVGMAVAGALAASAAALWTVYRLPPLAAARPEAWREAHGRRLRYSGAVAAGLVAVGAAAYAFGDTLGSGFLAMAAALGAAALLLPILLDRLLRLGARLAAGPLAEWAAADMRQQLSGLSLALMALLLALSANIGVGSMVGGFRVTFLDWLDQRLAAELYVRGADEAQSAAIDDWARERPEVSGVLTTRRANLILADQPVEAIGVVDHPTYREDWPLIDAAPGAWDALFAGEAVMLSEQAARRLDLALGDRVEIAGRPALVAGLYADYGNPKGQILGALRWIEATLPGAARIGTGLRVAPEDAPALAAALQERFDLSSDAMIDQRALKGAAVEVFETTFAVTAALNVLTLAVAGAALFLSFLTLADRRVAALAPVWAMGVDRRRLARLELAKMLGLAFLTALVAVPLGVLLAWLLVAVINVQAFGWRLPLHVFPGEWARLGALALLIAAVAAALPVLRLAQVSPATLLKVFAGDR
ncbi:MAG: ABC transporter permease [Pseudomonadota bacterium]